MKKVKKTSYKQNNVQESSDTDIKKFFIILVVLIIVIVGLYFLSSLIVKKRDNANNNTNTNVTISYDTLNVGMIFNRPYDEYYVIAYDSTLDDAMYYSTLITNYSKKEDAIKIYYCDLSKKVNESYKAKDGSGNSKASSVQELSFGDVTLLKIRNKKIVNYIENIDQIKSALK